MLLCSDLAPYLFIAHPYIILLYFISYYLDCLFLFIYIVTLFFWSAFGIIAFLSLIYIEIVDFCVRFYYNVKLASFIFSYDNNPYIKFAGLCFNPKYLGAVTYGLLLTFTNDKKNTSNNRQLDWLDQQLRQERDDHENRLSNWEREKDAIISSKDISNLEKISRITDIERQESVVKNNLAYFTFYHHQVMHRDSSSGVNPSNHNENAGSEE